MSVRRAAAPLALVAALAVVAFVLLGSGQEYTLRAEFSNSGGLVRGGEVRVLGRRVGGVGDIEVTPDGQASIELTIKDDRVLPLTDGTRAQIRTVGQAGVANHYVDLIPGPSSGEKLADGATLPSAQTQELVSLDAVLSSMDAPARAAIRDVLRHSSEIYAGSSSRYFNGMLAQLSPALQEVQGFAGQLASDKANIARLIDTSATASQAIASRRPDLVGAVANTATTMRALASEREALGDSLERAPAVLAQAGETFASAEVAVSALRPTLRAVPAAADPLGTVLDRLPGVLGPTATTLRTLRTQFPALQESLAGFAPLRDPTLAALRSASTALGDARPILAGLRPYGPDLLLGIFNGLIGISTGPYDQAGHYVHLEFTQSPQFFLGGAASPLFTSTPLVPGTFDLRGNVAARCPGSLHPPAPDGSNPFIPDPSTCDPSKNVSPEVNEPLVGNEP